jgi:glutamate formiminotransferase/formiminotetrahydrofolate cyclodeaminase
MVKCQDMKKLIECVPNFSEGNDMSVIKAITDQIESVDGIKLLDVDPGKATNRTVVTFVGNPDQVIEAAFLGIKKASELIDMSKHHGKHPRMGATDVCPLIPISNISMDEVVTYSHTLAKRVGNELNIPVFCYERAALIEERKNLAVCRSGEYEGLEERFKKERWKPDFGKPVFNTKAGATAIGARNFLVAYNINLNTTSTRRANAIAFDVREGGRVKREGDTLTGKIVKDDDGNTVKIPGTLKKTKAIGWFIEEYGIAQISMNLTDIGVTPVHMAFEEVCNKAQTRGIRVTGSELVGLVPLNAILDAGRYFLKKQQRSCGISDDEIIKIAVKSMGLDELKPFNPKEKIIEYMIEDNKTSTLIDMTLQSFADETASESPAPGGGSISAYLGALGISLGTMVANLSSHKRGWDDRWEEFSEWAVKGQEIKNKLLLMVDEDTRAFNQIMEAFNLSKSNEEAAEIRRLAILKATKNAIEIPLKVMQLSFDSLEVIKAMAKIGNPNSVSDAGVGALAASAAVSGAFLNVKINASGIKDKTYVDEVILKGKSLEKKTKILESEILAIVNKKIEQ